MNWKFVGGVVTIALLAALLVVVLGRPSDTVPQIEPVLQDEDGSPVEVTLPQIEKKPIRTNVAPVLDSLAKVDPVAYHRVDGLVLHSLSDPTYDMLTTRTGYLTPAQRERYNELHIIPWNPKVGDDCSQAPVTSVVSRVCKPVYETRYSHHYEQLSYAELEELHGDPAALYYLSRKGDHLPTEERIRLVIEAAAISGKPGELLSIGRVLRQRQGGSMTSEDVIRTKHALEIVAAEMGDERADVERSRSQIIELLGERAPKELEISEQEAVQILNEMNLVSVGTVGFPTPRGGEQ
ncbi:MAG: hypothetical protein AAF525_09245 [Pseudomonadota bacterium]